MGRLDMMKARGIEPKRCARPPHVRLTPVTEGLVLVASAALAEVLVDSTHAIERVGKLDRTREHHVKVAPIGTDEIQGPEFDTVPECGSLGGSLAMAWNCSDQGRFRAAWPGRRRPGSRGDGGARDLGAT